MIGHIVIAIDVEVVLEVSKTFMETPNLHAVLSCIQSLVLCFDLSSEGSSICLELCTLLMVAVVLFDFCKGSRVFEEMGCFSQSVVGPSIVLQHLKEPVGHGRCGSL